MSYDKSVDSTNFNKLGRKEELADYLVDEDHMNSSRFYMDDVRIFNSDN